MQPSESQHPEWHSPARPEQLTVLELMILVIGVAVGLWLVAKDVTKDNPDPSLWFLIAIGVLGGLSLVGPPLLLLELRRRRRPWGAGKVLWFAQGMASWIMWPPVISGRLQGSGFGSTTGLCWMYGTPLMALYVTLALLAGGWMKGGRRRRQRSWREQFGLLLGLAWACTGFYILYLLYGEDFRGWRPSAPTPVQSTSATPDDMGDDE